MFALGFTIAAAAADKAEFTREGDLIRPENYREWIDSLLWTRHDVRAERAGCRLAFAIR